MIIIRSNKTDRSTIDALDWIFFNKQNCDILFIQDTASIDTLTFSISSQSAKSNNYMMIDNITNYCNSEINYWYRRGQLLLKSEVKGNVGNAIVNGRIKSQVVNNSFVLDAINHFYESNAISRINRFSEMNTNKIINLNKASETGLNIPQTIISNKKNDIVKFCQQNKDIVVKDIDCDEFTIKWKNEKEVIFSSYAFKKELNDLLSIIENHNVKDYLLFYQQYIPKKYELRIFYLKGKFFPMAIFSQENEKTKIDFRNYDEERPNRCVPYILPKDIEQKLDNFMKSIDMNCGSIDMIYTPEGEYVFLEVNPVGQYQWLEKNCNYPVSKSIAEELITEQ